MLTARSNKQQMRSDYMQKNISNLNLLLLQKIVLMKKSFLEQLKNRMGMVGLTYSENYTKLCDFVSIPVGWIRPKESSSPAGGM
ncbi:MAG: hypothetical protein JW786_13030 [Desulfobacterales bacterium]|nr:hypothetical protein [Desulfobacterales bacterium]